MNGHNSLANTSKHRATVLNALDDTRIRNVRHLISPQLLVEEEYPITVKAASTVLRARAEVEDILARTDDRLIVVVGPCSIHNVDAAIAYAKLLKACADRLQDDLLIIMRSYFSKPRSTTGWKGLISDPDLDGSFQINKGLRMARKLYLDLNNMGVPVACEFLDTISPQWLADLVSWGAIGARTTESQVHRELVSGLSCAVGLKNGTNGDCKIAIDGCIAARAPHVFLSVGKVGLAAIVETEGNPWAHVILRGGSSGPNYDAESVAKVCGQLKKAGL
ncbi:3-deoxy-7-phosphoheptulonate synthase, partial [Ramicandelaber brevisporus]